MAGQKSWSRRFYGSSRKSLVASILVHRSHDLLHITIVGSALTCAKALQRDNLDVLYAGLLTARYMSVSLVRSQAIAKASWRDIGF